MHSRSRLHASDAEFRSFNRSPTRFFERLSVSGLDVRTSIGGNSNKASSTDPSGNSLSQTPCEHSCPSASASVRRRNETLSLSTRVSETCCRRLSISHLSESRQ